MRVCQGKSCSRRGSPQLLAQFREAASGATTVEPGRCQGYCKTGPSVRVSTADGGYVQYAAVAPDDVDEILSEVC